jgi:hypothetical protein
LPRLAGAGGAAYAAAPAATAAAFNLPTIAPDGSLPVIPLDAGAVDAGEVDQAAAAAAEAAVAEASVAEASAAAEAAVAEAAVAEAAVAEGVVTEVPQLDGIPAAAPPDPSTIPATAPAVAEGFPELDQFAAALVNGNGQQVVGFYAPGLSALPVVQQPGGSSDYISDEYGTVTQYYKPSLHGVVGLLAHNTLSGREFFYLGQNQDVFLVYGDGRTARFRIQTIQQYQALSPYDTRSDFVDLSNPGGPVLSHSQVYQRVYTTNGTLVLQTCIEANGEPTWGRLFVIAEPI